MVQLYYDTKDPLIAPSIVSYNTLMGAWAKSNDPEAPVRARRLLDEMLTRRKAHHDDHDIEPEQEMIINNNNYYYYYYNNINNNNNNNSPSQHRLVQPDAVSFSTLIDIYAKYNVTNSTQLCEELFYSMPKLQVRRSPYTFFALQHAYARSGQANAAQKAQAVLDYMLDLYHHKGDVFAKPNAMHYNAILNALSRRGTIQAAEQAVEMLNRMEANLTAGETGFDVEPDRLSYALTIVACARCMGQERRSANMAVQVLEKMEERARVEAQLKAQVSSVAPPSVRLDIECFNVVLTALSRVRDPDTPQRILEIIKRMEQYAAAGQEHVRPNIRSWNALLNSLTRSTFDQGDNSNSSNESTSSSSSVAKKAENILNHVFALHRNGVANVMPNAFTFTAVLTSYQRFQRTAGPLAPVRAAAIVRQMEELYEKGELESPPDVYHYTILCGVWARSRHPQAPDQCLQILTYMMERYQAGMAKLKPNVRTYNAVLDCLCRCGQVGRAEELLHHMLSLYERMGDRDAKPDAFSFNCVILAWCRATNTKGSGKRAEAVLDRFLQYQEDERNPSLGPDSLTFTRIITHYNKARLTDSPYRAEYVLNWWISLFKSGLRNIEPCTEAFRLVIEGYAHAKHADAGENAERLLRQMNQLQNEYPRLNLQPTVSLMNSALWAWAVCGDEDSGTKAENLLDEMERKFAAKTRPTGRSYEYVIMAYARSSSHDKARRAYSLFRKMDERAKKGQIIMHEYVYSLVINCCAFANANREVESEAFDIAIEVFNEIVNSTRVNPSARTFGWFFQACGRLKNSNEEEYRSQIEQAFVRCCQMGLINDFNFRRFRGAASEAILQKILDAASASTGQQRLVASNVSFHDIPVSWRKNAAVPSGSNVAQRQSRR